MPDRLTELEARVDSIETRLETIEHARQPFVTSEATVEPVASVAAASSEGGDEEAGYMSLAGRSVLILGGAYILRALTESSLLPQLGGMAAGLLYAAFWIWHGGRAALADRRPVALFDCATAAVIAYPLIWETTVRFHLINAAAGATLLLLVSTALVWTASRTSMPQLAWIAAIAGGSAFGAVAVGARSTLPLMIAATLFAVIAWLVSAAHDWMYTSWPAIASSDLLAMALIAAAFIGRSPHGASGVIGGSMAFGTIWLAALCARSLLLKRELNVAEVAQLIEASLIGTTGAAIAARMFQANMAPVGWFSIVVTIAMIAVTSAATREGLHAVPITASFVAALAALLGLPLLVGLAPASLAWAFAGMAAAEWTRHGKPLVPALHSVLWFCAAAVASGLLLMTLAAFVERAPGTIRLPFAAIAVAVLALAGFVRIDRVSDARGAGLTLLAIGALGTFAAVVKVIAMTGGMNDVMKVALMRTIVLAAAAALLGIMAPLMRSRSAARIARAVLVVGGAKLVLEDLRVSSAAILVGAFAAYGLAILVVARAPRLLRGAVKQSAPVPGRA